MSHVLRLRRLVALAAFALSAAGAQAGLGFTQVAGVEGDGPVTVYFPTPAPETPRRIGPFELRLATDAPPAPGNGRLVVISHGSGSSPAVHADLARALADAGFTVALPQHKGDNHADPYDAGPTSWKRRPAEVSRAIDAIGRDARFAPLLRLDKVGMYGMSAGGHTALSLAGGRWSPGNFKRHCEAHIAQDFHTCAGLYLQQTGGPFDAAKRALVLATLRWRFDDDRWQTHTDPRIAAIVAGVPAAADFDAASLAAPRVPLALVTAGGDLWLHPPFHSDRILAACKTCEHLAHLPEAGHGALLSPPPPVDRMSALAARLLGDPPGFDRSRMPAIDRAIAAFFSRQLLP